MLTIIDDNKELFIFLLFRKYLRSFIKNINKRI